MKLQLETKNAYGSNTSRWLVKNQIGETVASVLRGNYPFAKYRLIKLGHPTTEFQNQASLLAAL